MPGAASLQALGPSRQIRKQALPVPPAANKGPAVAVCGGLHGGNQQQGALI